jgi:chromosome segregation protein
MRLEKIKLSGFKSFVDPTTIPFSSDLVGIVGPNGCGKSNVIDAVRWVLGESSAKHLRGDQMADVVFNGSTTRKPVGQAFVELIFDNTDATITGEFAGYQQIALRRQVNREGQSVYFLNGTRCRRKDITDLFLGTGLGPRSYAIIEQGTISRLVEAKPDELRVFLEEAAGISKYKERRRDTENRMRRTRENLERIADLCDEIEKQCRHLKRQATTAERYKLLKAEERQFKAQLLALRWQRLDEQDEGQLKAIKLLELKVEQTLAAQRELEKNIEQQREQHSLQQKQLGEVQAEFYATGSEIAKVEQALQHQQSLKKQHESELENVSKLLTLSTQEQDEGDRKLAETNDAIKKSEAELVEVKQRLETANKTLADQEQAMADWQQSWDEFTYRVAEPKRSIDVENAKIAQLDRQLLQASKQLSKFTNEQKTLQEALERVDLSDLEKQHALSESQQQKSQSAVQENREKMASMQSLIHQESELLADLRAEKSRLTARVESITVLQRSSLGEPDETERQWLKGLGLAQAPKLIEKIDVVTGWEKAIETVLGVRLQAICTEGMDAVVDAGMQYPVDGLTFFDTTVKSQQSPCKTSLASLITSDLPAMALLKNVHFAETLEQAKVLMNELKEHESVITKECVWLHVDSIYFQHNAQKDSALALEKEKKELTQQLHVVSTNVLDKEGWLIKARDEVSELEKQGIELRQQEGNAVRQVSQLWMQINEQRSKLEMATQRLAELEVDINQLVENQATDQERLTESKRVLEQAIGQSAQIETQRAALQKERSVKKDLLDRIKQQVHSSRERVHSLMLKIEAQRSSQALIVQNAERVNERLLHAKEKVAELQAQLTMSDEPIEEKEVTLADLLKNRVAIEKRLVEVRTTAESTEQTIRNLETTRHEFEQLVQQARDNTSAAKIEHQAILVRKQTLIEQLESSGVELADTLNEMPKDANETHWQEQVDALAEKINGLGLINLTAIEEYETQSERKQYLNDQQLDLTESLRILEEAIDKIDRESKALFKETFDKVNAGFEKRFPKLFGGGHAYLQQTGEDLLETGVTVMARPPGKRNSSIHLLSGGEKALTAVALVFSIFDLNPSPFCMLDEVDAPLDEANVGRFAELVKEMSDNVQMILITHNKSTMEMAQQLAGVTMKEPGVSRLVTVDLEEAAKMATG